MYAYIEGKLTYKSPTFVVIETGGIGYQIHVSLHTYGKLPQVEHCRLYTYLHIKEDAHTLYGFAQEEEKRLFLHLLSVSGIGASTARMILSSITPDEIQNAIVRGDVATIQRIKGIGAKSAQRMILELQDKLKKEGLTSLTAAPLVSTAYEEALSALIMLGFSKIPAEKVIQKVHQDGMSVEELIKVALKNL